MTAAVWVQLGVGVATVVLAYFVARGGNRASHAAHKAARRDQWWRRTEWSIDKALQADEQQSLVGILALSALIDSPLADQDTDVPIAVAVASALVEEASDQVGPSTSVEVEGVEDAQDESPFEGGDDDEGGGQEDDSHGGTDGAP